MGKYNFREICLQQLQRRFMELVSANISLISGCHKPLMSHPKEQRLIKKSSVQSSGFFLFQQQAVFRVNPSLK